MMIENIQNSQNNQNEKKQRNNGVKLPKNIRQIGPMDGDKRIYIEDYVMTYMKQIAMKSYGNYHVAILLGHVMPVEGEDNVFISGAVEVEDILFDDDKVFGNETWAKIYDDIKKYFDEEEIVGWYITRPGLQLELNEYLYKIHIDNFAGNNKVFLMYDSIEREEAFYLFNNQTLSKQDGYYIYYEKNHNMQSYMIDHKDKESIEAGYVDQTCINIRSVIERKNNEKIQRKRSLSVMYAAASVCALFLIIVAVTMLSGRGVQKNQAIIAGTNSNNDKNQVVKASDNAGSTQVNVQPGNISSIKDENVVGDKTGKDDNEIGIIVEDTTPIDGTDSKDTNAKDPDAKDPDVKDPDVKDPDVKDSDTKEPDTKEPDSQETVSKPTSYTIKRGDTLNAISLKFYNNKTYVKKIMELNSIENQDTIYAGQTIKLP